MTASMPWPDLSTLELLVAVAEHGSLGSGARALGMAQPNASRAIKGLERSLGIVLLRRTPRGSTVTPEGATVVDWARAVLEAAGHLLLGAESLGAQHNSQLRIAASMTVAEYLMPAWLAELRREQPELKIKLTVCNSSEVFERLADGDCELGFVESPGVPSGLRSVTVARDRLVVVVGASHPWAGRRRPVRIEELASTPLVVREAGSGTRTVLDRALRGFDPVPPTLELGSNAAVRVSVSSGMAPAVLSTLAVDSALRSGELRAVSVDGLNLERRLRAAWPAPHRLAGPAGDLVRLAKEIGTP
ncbi:LysR substrate-binding domain-containing protein [Saxibacter everestensis]|uniref:LysR substrate-binding domain-containing protein n=1 Tax=Saxibacter everestensis TaxID=2909229 RepID=A0ABY8QTH0_9MICO|nr:LysR substrate-binding domain-containing protein [Brevibacteriaceae bacterium ZFBP1038]